MSITIELTPEVEEWVSKQVQSGQFSSAEEFVQAQLKRDSIEEMLEEALSEPAAPLTEQDWTDAKKRLDRFLLAQNK